MKRSVLLAVASLGACATHSDSAALVGGDLDDVRSRLGPPIACSYGGGAWTMSYEDLAGSVIDDAVVAVDEIVITAAPNLRPNTGNATEWSGARIEDVVEALGAGRVESTSSHGAVVRFGTERLLVIDGRVVGRAR